MGEVGQRWRSTRSVGGAAVLHLGPPSPAGPRFTASPRRQLAASPALLPAAGCRVGRVIATLCTSTPERPTSACPHPSPTHSAVPAAGCRVGRVIATLCTSTPERPTSACPHPSPTHSAVPAAGGQEGGVQRRCVPRRQSDPPQPVLTPPPLTLPCLQLAAKKEGYSDVVYLDAKTDTYLEEVSSCNIFVVKGKTIRTPPLQVLGVGSGPPLRSGLSGRGGQRRRRPWQQCRQGDCSSMRWPGRGGSGGGGGGGSDSSGGMPADRVLTPAAPPPCTPPPLPGHHPAWRDAALHH